mgnify:CR=1 FL=1
MNAKATNGSTEIELKKFRSWMDGAFYQSWDLDEEGGMVGIIEREFCHSADASKEVIEHIDRLINAASDQSDVNAFLSKFTGDYDPAYEGMKALEWFTLLNCIFKETKTPLTRSPRA